MGVRFSKVFPLAMVAVSTIMTSVSAKHVVKRDYNDESNSWVPCNNRCNTLQFCDTKTVRRGECRLCEEEPCYPGRPNFQRDCPKYCPDVYKSMQQKHDASTWVSTWASTIPYDNEPGVTGGPMSAYGAASRNVDIPVITASIMIFGAIIVPLAICLYRKKLHPRTAFKLVNTTATHSAADDGGDQYEMEDLNHDVTMTTTLDDPIEPEMASPQFTENGGIYGTETSGPGQRDRILIGPISFNMTSNGPSIHLNVEAEDSNGFQTSVDLNN